MRAEELELRADERKLPRAVLCLAIDVLEPVIREAMGGSSRWRLIRRAGLRAVLRLLAEYRGRNCVDPSHGEEER